MVWCISCALFVRGPTSQPSGGRGCYCSSYQWEIHRNTQIKKQQSPSMLFYDSQQRAGCKRVEKKWEEKHDTSSNSYSNTLSRRRYQIQTRQRLHPPLPPPRVFSAIISRPLHWKQHLSAPLPGPVVLGERLTSRLMLASLICKFSGLLKQTQTNAVLQIGTVNAQRGALFRISMFQIYAVKIHKMIPHCGCFAIERFLSSRNQINPGHL